MRGAQRHNVHQCQVYSTQQRVYAKNIWCPGECCFGSVYAHGSAGTCTCMNNVCDKTGLQSKMVLGLLGNGKGTSMYLRMFVHTSLCVLVKDQ